MHGVLVIDVQIPGRRSLANDWCTSEQFVVARSHPTLAADEFIEAFELGDPKRRLQVGHPEVPAEFVMNEALLGPKA